MPVADVRYERLAFNGLVTAQVLECEHALTVAAMPGDGVRNLTFVEDTRAVTCDGIEGIGKVRHDDPVTGIDQ